MSVIPKLITFLTFSVFILMSCPAQSNALMSNGYDVSVSAKYKKKKSAYKIWGTVKGGKECENLNIHLVFVGQGKNVGFEKDIRISSYKLAPDGFEFTAKEKSPSGSKKDSISATMAVVQCKQ